VGVHLGMCMSNSHTLPYSQPPGNMKCDSRASILAYTFTSPYLAHEPKARVATLLLYQTFKSSISILVANYVIDLSSLSLHCVFFIACRIQNNVYLENFNYQWHGYKLVLTNAHYLT
jgi:hypothetical protein